MTVQQQSLLDFQIPVRSDCQAISANMAHIDPVYEEICSEKGFSFDEDEHIASSHSRRPKFSTIILSITTVIFGLLSLYLSLKPDVVCIAAKDPYTFSDGYETEWGMRSSFPAVKTIVT